MSTRTARGRRVRDLFEGFLARVGTDADIVTKAHCLRVAELIAIAEETRAMTTGTELKPDMINAVTRIESTAARAERALLKAVPAKPKGSEALAEYLAKKHGAKPNA